MMDIKEFSRNIEQLTHNGQYAEALQFFKENKHRMNKIEIEKDDTVLANAIRCMTERGFYHSVLVFMEKYNIHIEPQTSRAILQNYGWSLYFAYRALINHQFSMTDFYKIDEAILQNRIVQFSQATKERTTRSIEKAKDLLINVIVKREIKKLKPDYDFILDFLENINPKLLDTKSFETTIKIKGKSKRVELQSARENYYMIYTKALLHEEKADLCVEKIEEAFGAGIKFHFYGDVWLKYLMAQAEVARWNFDKAIKLINEEVLPKKQDWFIYQTLMICYRNKCEPRIALRYAKKALEQRGELKYKTKLLSWLANIYSEMREREKELRVIALSLKIRADQGWKENLIFEIRKNEIDNYTNSSIGEMYKLVLKDLDNI